MTNRDPRGAPPGRLVRFTGREDVEPAEAWEWPATEDELLELSTRRFERLPHRPANPGEVPAGALDALEPALGELALEQLFVMPRTVRTVGGDAPHWVVTPTEVLAVTPDRLAVWLDDPSGGAIRATMATGDVAAILDRTVLLHGRLELVGRDASVVVRYNTVGRSDVRGLLRTVRSATEPVTEPRIASPEADARADPDRLPHKWMALAKSSDVHPAERGPMLVAAGELQSERPILHTGIAVLTAAELIVATDPTPDVRMAQYGFDLLVVPRGRVLGIGGEGTTLAVAVDAWPGHVTLEVSAHPTLVEAAVAEFAPIVGTA